MRFILRWIIAVAGLLLLFLTTQFHQLRTEASAGWQFLFWGDATVFEGNILQNDFHELSLPSSTNEYSMPSWSHDGEKLIYSNDSEAIIQVQQGQNLSEQVTFPQGTEHDYDPHWSPVADEFLFIREQMEDNRLVSQVFIGDKNGTHPLLDNELPTGAYRPQWSPDGTRILFEGYGNNIDSYFVYDLETEQLVDILDGYDIAYQGYASWAPDSEWIIFTADDNANASLIRIFKVRTNGQDLQAITPVQYEIVYYEAQWSPVGDYIAVLSEDYNTYTGLQFNLFSPEGQHKKTFKLNDLYIYEEDWLWTPDGQWIVFTDDWGYLYRLEVATGEVTKIIEDERQYFYAPSISKAIDLKWHSFRLSLLISLFMLMGLFLSIKHQIWLKFKTL